MEGRKYEIWGVLSGEPIGIYHSIVLNDSLLNCFFRSGRAYFLYEPGFFAGTINLDIWRDGKILASLETTIEPNLAKITRQEYYEMIADLASFTKSIFRFCGVTVPAATSFNSRGNNLITLELLRLNFDQFHNAVRRIQKQPMKVLKTHVTRREILKASHISERAIDDGLARGQFRTATIQERLAAPLLTTSLRGQWLPEVWETKPHETTNIYENRAILGFLRWLNMALSRFVTALDSPDLNVSDSVLESWKTRIRRWKIQLIELSKSDLFRELPFDGTLRSTSAFRLHPDYSAAYTAMARIRAGFGDLAAYSPKVGIDQTHRLYEMWCYFGILSAALEKFPMACTEISKFLRSAEDRRQIGASMLQRVGEGLNLTESLVLTYQPRFSKTSREDGARTTLVDCVPDIVISKRDHSGQCAGLVVVDPKYRVGASLTDGIRDLHVYRDAIVGSTGARLTKAAVVLAPRSGKVTSILPTDHPYIWRSSPPGDNSSFVSLLDASLSVLS